MKTDFAKLIFAIMSKKNVNKYFTKIASKKEAIYHNLRLIRIQSEFFTVLAVGL